MLQRVSRWISVVSVLALATVGVLAAMVPAGAGGQGPEPNCEVDRGDLEPLQEPEACAELEVTKVVAGEVPPGTTFPVVVDCEEPPEPPNGTLGGGVGTQQEDLPEGRIAPFTETLTFGEEGGTQSIFIASPGGICTVSEEPPAGCELEGIEPEVTEVDAPEVFPVTVTNSCEVEPAAEVIEEVPAAPVAASPRFTG